MEPGEGGRRVRPFRGSPILSALENSFHVNDLGNNEMSVTKRGNIWHADFVYKGERIRFSTERTDKKEALEVVEEEKRKLKDRRQLGIKPDLTLYQATKKYVDSLEGQADHSAQVRRRKKLLGLDGWDKRTRTDKHGKQVRMFHLNPNMLMRDLRSHHVSELKERRKAEGYKPNSIRLEVMCLQRTWNLCRTEWNVQVDPDVTFKAPLGEPKARFISWDEEAQILRELDAIVGVTKRDQDPQESIGAARAKCLYLFLVDTGVRLGEARKASWKQFDFASDPATFRVYRSKAKKTGKRHLMDGNLLLTSRVVAELKRYHNQQPKPFGHLDWAIKVLRRAINLACNQDEQIIEAFGRATIHSCRDTYCTRMRSLGMSDAQVQKLLGHSTPAMTKKYEHMFVDDLAPQARLALENRLSQNGTVAETPR